MLDEIIYMSVKWGHLCVIQTRNLLTGDMVINFF